MFAYSCLKANGTHLGTCIDRFYFGSCCRMDGDLPPSVLYRPTTTEPPAATTTTTLATEGVAASAASAIATTDATRGTTTTTAAATTSKPTSMTTERTQTTTTPRKPTKPTSSRPTVKPKPSGSTTARPPTKKPTRKPPVFKPTSAKPTTPSATKPAVSVKPSQSSTGPYTKPTTKPTAKPTSKPTTKPTTRPNTRPTTRPTSKPTSRPTPKPSTKPTNKPATEQSPKPVTKPATTYATTSAASEQPTTSSQVPQTTTTVSPTSASPTMTNATESVASSTLAASGVTTQQTVWSASQGSERNATTASPATASSGSVSLVTWTLVEAAGSPSPAASQAGPDEATTSAGWVEVSLSQPEASTTSSTATTTTTSTATTTTTSASTTAAPDTLATTTTPTSTSASTSSTSTPSTSTTTTTTTTSTTTPSTTIPTTTPAAPTVTTPGIDEILANLSNADYREVCGRRLVPDARIVGGQKASFGKWPWQISLRQWRTSTYLHKCGAALLNENWAVTAAHCVENVPPSDLLLRLGEHDVSTEDEPYGFEERRVQIVASHPQFDPRTFEYDLALLRFYEPVAFQPNIIPICVPTDDRSFVGHTAHVTGWGRLYEDGPLPSVLQEVSVPVINNTLCESMYRSAGYIEHIPEIFICAGWQKGGSDSCEGDSGGPMVIQREDKRWLLAGVISWGIGCAEPNQPGVYTRISEFREWINQILQF
ncbi:serine proteinase stubble isoform X3 [Schistocerca piceifrons]|nr:serine proteinase stubble isoform X3 [Schistocerca piceifrons]